MHENTQLESEVPYRWRSIGNALETVVLETRFSDDLSTPYVTLRHSDNYGF
jgi:hypothetical protein